MYLNLIWYSSKYLNSFVFREINRKWDAYFSLNKWSKSEKSFLSYFLPMRCVGYYNSRICTPKNVICWHSQQCMVWAKTNYRQRDEKTILNLKIKLLWRINKPGSDFRTSLSNLTQFLTEFICLHNVFAQNERLQFSLDEDRYIQQLILEK